MGDRVMRKMRPLTVALVLALVVTPLMPPFGLPAAQAEAAGESTTVTEDVYAGKTVTFAVSDVEQRPVPAATMTIFTTDAEGKTVGEDVYAGLAVSGGQATVTLPEGTYGVTLTVDGKDYRYPGVVTISATSPDTISLFVPVVEDDPNRGPSSSKPPYLVPTMDGVEIKSLLTVGDAVPGKDGKPYRMVGIPDGLGAYDNGDGTFTLLMNHELRDTDGAVRAHGAKGAFVSKWIIDKETLEVKGGEDLIQRFVLWNKEKNQYDAPVQDVALSRLCSADLPPQSAFYDEKSGKGYPGRLFMNGEEKGREGRAFAHALDGTSYELPALGKASWENILVHPKTGEKTVVIGLDDTSPGQGSGTVFVYIGEKQSEGNPAERAGLNNGTLYGLKVEDLPQEKDDTQWEGPKPFTLHPFGDARNKSGAELAQEIIAGGVTQFQRPEDGAWDPHDPNVFYFVTTATMNNKSRLWKLTFNDVTQPEVGGTIEMLLKGDEGQKMMDNLTVTPRGEILIQEDPGKNDHIAKVWRYTLADGKLEEVARHDPRRFAPGGEKFLTNDEESSGIIDVSDILGEGWYLLDVQAHFTHTDPELVEGGQLLAMYVPPAQGGAPQPQPGESAWRLTILHTNDTHAHLENGARLATLIKEERAKAENVLLLDAGDVFTGTLFFTQYEGLADLDFMDLLGYQAMTIGNHEFDKGPEGLAKFVKDAPFPVLSANIDFGEEPALGGLVETTIGESTIDELSSNLGGKIYPAVVLDVNGEKVGLFGLTTPETAFISSPGEHIRFRDPVEAARETVAQLQAKGVQKIIALTHIGYAEDLTLAEAVPEIDVIVGGHSHTRLDEPVVIQHADGTQTVIVQAHEHRKYLGRLDVTFNAQGDVIDANGKLIPTSDKDADDNYTVAEDPEAKALIDELDGPIQALKQTVVGQTAVFLDGERDHVRTQETNLGNLIADGMLDFARSFVPEAQVAITNGGGIRSSIPAGEITLGQVMEVLPFGNVLVTLELSGEDLIAALENGVSAVEQKKGYFPHVAGLRYRYDSSKPAGQRIVGVEIKTENGYRPIDPKATYTVVTNKFMADGGDGYTMFKAAQDAGKMTNLFYPDYEVFVAYLEKIGTVGEAYAGVEGRIVDVAGQAGESEEALFERLESHVDQTDGITARVTVRPKAPYASKAAVIFELLRSVGGTPEPIAITALEKEGWSGTPETLYGRFNVTGSGYEVRVFILDGFSGSPDRAEKSLAEPLVLPVE
ncbi:5'-nucleotidase C-terminal domain-containing protein [Hydrogenibacillus schlegelii]|nr:5'-nucleotidase C-terminal domain-containing protein [Hydrogenibacillus schlegelii]